MRKGLGDIWLFLLFFLPSLNLDLTVNIFVWLGTIQCVSNKREIFPFCQEVWYEGYFHHPSLSPCLGYYKTFFYICLFTFTSLIYAAQSLHLSQRKGGKNHVWQVSRATVFQHLFALDFWQAHTCEWKYKHKNSTRKEYDIICSDNTNISTCT